MPKLKEIATTPPKTASKRDAAKRLKELAKKLELQQILLYANKKYSLLIILQGMDTAGKDGTIRHVFSSVNPQGCNVKSFGVPTQEDLAHDFIWRAYPHFPAKGMIQIFNRSYYDTVLVTTVEKFSTTKKNDERCLFINNLEEHLVRSNTIILKFFLHISTNEQTLRINKRLSNPNKMWKYNANDKKVAKQDSKYMTVYEHLFKTCNKIPWTIVPADVKWYRNLLIAEKIVAALEGLELKFPNHSTAKIIED